MSDYKVIEKFVSIDGEGPTSGQLAAFIRLQGCNLRCSWCDTPYSYESSDFETMTETSIISFIRESKVKQVTLTGGEPLICDGIEVLIKAMSQLSVTVHIETNGSVAIDYFKKVIPASNVHYVVDYKLPLSNMEEHMEKSNFNAVSMNDAYKFVVGCNEDLERAITIIRENQLTKKCQVFFSPVGNEIAPKEVVEFMIKHHINDVRLQLQLHKYIWTPDQRGV